MAVASGVPDVVLTPADIPGADLSQPFERAVMQVDKCTILEEEVIDR